MKKTAYLSLLFFLLTTSSGIKASQDSVMEILQVDLSENIHLVENYLFLSEEQIDLLEFKTQMTPPAILPYYAVFESDSLLGYAVEHEAYGRYHPFVFLLVVDPNFTIKNVQVLEYHSPHGHEIKDFSFRSQFINKTTGNELIIGQDIDGISGATISSNSITNHIRMLLHCLKVGIDKD